MATPTDSWVAAHPGHHDDDAWSGDAMLHAFGVSNIHMLPPDSARRRGLVQGRADIRFLAHRFSATTESGESDDLRRRLDNANRYFHRKATEVYSDDVALRLLVAIYEVGVVDLEDFDACQYGVPLAKLTAANFCEIGAKAIHITESGQQFIESIG